MGNLIKEENFDCYNDENNNTNKPNCKSQIGFTSEEYHIYIFLVLSIVDILLSIVVFIDFIIHKLKKHKSRSYGSMKLFFRVLNILDFFSSLYWLISSLALSKVTKINNNALCKPLSFIYVFFFIFNLFFIYSTLRHFQELNYNPIDSIYKPRASLIKYSLIGIFLASSASLISFFAGILGRSPMNTCFINTELNYLSVIVYGIAIIIIFAIFYQIIYGLYFSKMFINNELMRELYIQNSIYSIIFCGLYIPMLLLLIITTINHKNILDSDSGMQLFSYFSTILLYFTPSILGILSIYQGMTQLNCCKKRKKEADLNDISNILSQDLTLSLTLDDQYDWLDKHAMESFMKNILLGIAISLKKSKNLEITENLEKDDFVDSVKYEVNFKNFKQYGIEIADIQSDEYLNVKIIEYAPKCFAFLRNLEEINIDNMIESFMPLNNKEGMKKSAGKSGSFFISTDNQEFMIKTLKKEEFELIKFSFLKEYIKYIKKNPKSLICRIYGMYCLIQYGGAETFIIVMRNVIGSLKNNIVAKFDLKGSTINREIKGLDMTKIDNGVMKDVNFNDIEFGIMVNNDNIKKINKRAQRDSKFLANMGLMDYSLFVVKLSLNKEEASEVFGEGIQEEIEKDYLEVINEQTVTINTNNLDSTINTVPTKDSFKDINNKYKHYKQYLFPGLSMGTGYIISIIDFLQSYNFYKIVENKYKTTIQGRKSDTKGGISCVEPKLYSERFINYVQHLTEVKHILTGEQSK